MSFEIITSNIVLTGNEIVPGLISQLFLVKNNIVQESEFDPNCFFSPALSQIITKKFNILVLQQQIQYFPQPDYATNTEDNGATIKETLLKLVSSTPIKFNACGINFVWIIIPENNETIQSFSKRLFDSSKKGINALFNSPDTKYGAYFSQDIDNCRLKLTILPVKSNPLNPATANKPEHLQAAFNYHFEPAQTLSFDEKVEELKAFIGNWGKYFRESEKIINTLV